MFGHPTYPIKEFDTTMRNVMNTAAAKHTDLMNSILYLPRGKGGRGMRSLERSYKEIKIKTALKIYKNNDKRMKIVREFHKINVEKSSYSIIKESMKYAVNCDINLTVTGDQCTIKFVDTKGDTQETDKMNILTQEIARKRNHQYQLEICNSSWQGVNYANRQNDKNIIKDYFSWIKNWSTCPTSTIVEYFLMFYQLLATKCFLLTRSTMPITDIKCRICDSREESVKHLLSNCSILVMSTYKARHDNALKCFIFPMLHDFGLIKKIPPWYSNKKVDPYMENEYTKFWWDIPEYNGKENEDDSRTLRPDGKIMVNRNGDKYIMIIEITIPWMENREEKYKYKQDKYKDILSNIKLENPGYTVDQVTLVMDVFGGYGPDLRENIGKILKCRSTQDDVIKNMQKCVISSLCNISRVFKIRTK